jgi:stearoyl-CoA desaturase (Delta-9 desaturase)
MPIILSFFIAHWFLSLFFQTFFQHRYASHRMFTTNKYWERVFYLLAYLFERIKDPEAQFPGHYPERPIVDRMGSLLLSRLLFGAAYTTFYIFFAPYWWLFLLLPIHFMMGPIHGAIVNWCGHKYGYTNFDNKDKSRNTMPFDFLMPGELFQNNHHKHPGSANFAKRWFEIDPVYPVMKVMHWMRIITLRKVY